MYRQGSPTVNEGLATPCPLFPVAVDQLIQVKHVDKGLFSLELSRVIVRKKA